jgi:hypothetical protein
MVEAFGNAPRAGHEPSSSLLLTQALHERRSVALSREQLLEQVAYLCRNA